MSIIKAMTIDEPKKITWKEKGKGSGTFFQLESMCVREGWLETAPRRSTQRSCPRSRCKVQSRKDSAALLRVSKISRVTGE